MKMLVKKENLENEFLSLDMGNAITIATNGENELVMYKNIYNGTMCFFVGYNNGWSQDNCYLSNNVWKFSHPYKVNKGLKSILYRKWLLKIANKYN